MNGLNTSPKPMMLREGSVKSAELNLADMILKEFQFDDEATVKHVLEIGPEQLNSTTGLAQKTTLHAAAMRGFYNITKLLLEKGVNPNIRDKNGETALHTAVLLGYVELIALLLEYGANINERASTSITPLMRAVFTGDIKTVKFLCEQCKTLDITMKTAEGKSARIQAKERGHKDVACYLKRLEKALLKQVK